MTHALSRRALMAQSLAAGASTLALSACGSSSAQDASATTQKRPIKTVVPVASTGTTFNWQPLCIGAGGYVTGIDIAKDGTKVIRCDLSGAYIWSDTAAQWQPLLTSSSMPASEWGSETVGVSGVYEAVIAPSNTSRIYVVFNSKVFRSDNKGATFTKTSLAPISAGENDEFRMFGKKMAVDPVNPDIVFVGCETGGLFISRDGGSSWTRQTSIPSPGTKSGVRIVFDATSSASGSTPVVYVSTQGSGIYRSSDGGATFRQISSALTTPLHMVCDSKGQLWVTNASGTGNLWRYSSGAWSQIGPTDRAMKTIAIDPANASHVVVADDGGTINQSFDGGATWTGFYWANYPSGSGTRVAKDIPWLAWTNEGYMTSGQMVFDPSATNKLYFAEGIGVWWTNPPTSYTAYNWNSQSKGIEQLVSNTFVSPPTGGALYLAWDRPVFKITDPTVYPSTHGPNNKYSIVHGWSGDYAPDNSSFIVAMMNNWNVEQSGYSTDGGSTWSQFGSVPPEVPGKIGGCIAAGSTNNFVWVTNNNGNVWYTNNRGSTWAQSSIPGVPTSGETGWGYAYYLARQIVAADKVNLGTFYLYNYLSPNAGLYRSTNGGASFTKVFSGTVSDWSNYNAKLRSVPGKAGHLFFTSGQQDGTNPAPVALMRSTDGGTTWTAVPNVLECYDVGFGAGPSGSTYPSIYIVGYVSGTFGIWRSDDNAASWTNLGNMPLGKGDMVKTISGDMSAYGKVYVGFAGSGCAFGSIA